MTTILLLNAASSFLALVGVAGFFALRERRARRHPVVQVLYVTTGNARPLPQG
jgi:MYXO-CTERM domain-containing protein